MQEQPADVQSMGALKIVGSGSYPGIFVGAKILSDSTSQTAQAGCMS